ncbi:hypothetical protein [Nocardia bovistercoris]|uniref:Uncharacterized protein n=1 Tax=Nocardia bovistercoris TaxID=2785916 RepID=A0A931N4P1_9NOCA|nr:hypothetical protein [Nocardia bovistercoris]MBH0778912.1 hypothetical protein [Nocardia bovistercoris]
MRAFLLTLTVCAVVSASVGPAGATGAFGPLAPPNPYLGPAGTATMHGDAGSSDATALPGPGPGTRPVTVYPLAAACPTLLQGYDGMVVGLCTSIAGRTPTVHLFDPDFEGPVGTSSAALELTKGSLLGGVYAYLDHADRLVLVDGARALVRVGHTRDEHGRWRLAVDSSTDLSGAIPEGDNVTGLVADWSGAVWFATGGGVVGTVLPDGAVSTVALPEGERVANSISAAPSGRVAIATTHALYEFRADGSGRPERLWRAPYDRGPGRKPGQLSWGTGSTPTYFGPDTGADYLTIVDNGADQVRALVFRSGGGAPVCSAPVLAGGGAGSENSPIGVGHSVFVASTYGYPYPATPDDAGPALPSTAPFTGGMTRVDVGADGCRVVWDNAVRSAVVPHVSTADGYLYTVERTGAAVTTPVDGYEFAVLDPDTGEVLSRSALPGTVAHDPIQMSALIDTRARVWQGTVTGIVRIG